MKKKTKLIIEIFAAVTLIVLLGVGIFSSSAVSDDPADSYQYQEAECEDYSIDLWFDYSFRKTFTEDCESTGMDTFSIYMAKNEIESAQFVLYSEEDHEDMTATISPFTNGNGDTVNAEIYYEFYLTIENVNADSVWGDSTFIREGEVPDPVVPLTNVGSFKLNEYKSQAFLIRAKTDFDTAPGWYSAQLDIKNSDNEVVKTATVYLKVWDFALSEETALESAFEISTDNRWGGNYQVFYDYLLENRMCGCDLPMALTDSEAVAYLTNDRVTSIRVNTNHHDYIDRYYTQWPAIYNTLAQTPYWEQIKGKFYAYTADEPLPKIIVGSGSERTVDGAKSASFTAEANWGDTLRTVIPVTENHAYPYDHYNKPLSQYSQGELKDSVQELIDSDASFIWCSKIYEFTPDALVRSYGSRRWENFDEIRGGSGYPYSGAWGIVNQCGGWDFFDWELFYGAENVDRYRSDIAYKNKYHNEGLDRELWTYCAGYNGSFSYCNHLVESTGLQTKMLFWQCYQEDVTGYLYYATNNWDGSSVIDNTTTGAKTTCQWRVNMTPGLYGGYNVYSDGVLFYGRDMGKVRGVDIIGSLRVEIMRDGIEEYQMMYQLAQLKGDSVADSFVNSVSNNVVDYVSMPNYNRSTWSSSMDDYDIMEAARRNLGNALEEASIGSICEHNFDAGTVTTAATCARTGITTYTCTNCGATKEEVIPSLHTYGATWTKVSGLAPTCNANGNEVFRCDLCGFEKPVTTTAYHFDSSHYIYEVKNSTAHDVKCDVCDELLQPQPHNIFAVTVQPTCTVDGYTALECKQCGYKTNETVIPATGHNYVDGVCTNCGEAETAEIEVVYGDMNDDGKVTAADLNILSKAIVGTTTLTEAQEIAGDVSGDGKLTATDTNYISKFMTGSLPKFPVES